MSRPSPPSSDVFFSLTDENEAFKNIEAIQKAP